MQHDSSSTDNLEVAFPNSSSPSLEIVKSLDLAATPTARSGELVLSAKRAFQLIEPWFQASDPSQNPLLGNIITQVKKHASLYLEAIDMSIKASGDGIAFCEDAISLCSFLSEETSSVDDLVKYIDDMQELASQAQQSAEDMVSKFRSARQGLFQASTSIPGNVAYADQGARYAEASKQKYQRLAAIAGTIANGVNQGNGPFCALIETFSTSVPYLGLILPVVLPLVAFAAQKAEEKFTAKAELRAMQEISCKEAIVQLEHINADLDELVKNVGVFAEWWTHMKTLLDGLKFNVSKLDSTRLDKMRAMVTEQRWRTVSEQYSSYTSEISRLQDFYPSVAIKNSMKPQHSLRMIQGKFLANEIKVDLVSTVSALSKNVDNCRTAFQALYSSSSNAHRKEVPLLRAKLDDIRKCLKTEWQGLVHYLELVHAFADDVACTDPASQGGEPYDNVFWATTLGLVKIAQEVVHNNKATRDMLASHKSMLTKSLKSKPTRSKTMGLLMHSESESIHKYENCSARPPTPAGIPSGSVSLEESLRSVSSSLKELVNFWHSRTTVLHTFRTSNDTPTEPNISSTQLAAAIASISMALDTLVHSHEATEFSVPGSGNQPRERFHVRQMFVTRSQSLWV